MSKDKSPGEAATATKQNEPILATLKQVEPATELAPEEGETPEVLATGAQTKDIRRFSTALALVQGEVLNAKKSRENTHFKTKYADLVEVTDACRPALARHLIAWIQTPMLDDQGNMFLRTKLIHGPSGQFVQADYPLAAAAKAAAQAKVGELTYARRASLSCMVGVASENDDDDGESVGDRDRPQDQQGQVPTKSKNQSKAEEWADWAAGRKIPSIKTQDDLVAWEGDAENQQNIAALVKLSPDHHRKIKEALTQAGARLGLGQVGQSEELGPNA